MSEVVNQEADRLVESVRQGDEDAVRRLDERLSSRLRGYIGRKISGRLGARLDTEDVLQQTLVELLQIIKKGERPIRDLDLLSRAISKNVVAQCARRKSIYFGRLDDGPPGAGDSSPQPFGPAARETGPGTKMLHKERNEMIKEAIATLKPGPALIIRLRYFAPGERKRKYSEIAEIVGMTPAATEKACQRAKKQVQEYLQRNYPRSGLIGDL